MSTQIIPTPVMTMLIRRQADFTVKRLAGIDNVPHLCVKVRHGDGYAWFGINILSILDNKPWSAETTQIIEARFMEAMRKIIDLKEMITDVNRLMDSIQDITTGRRRPIMFGGDSNEKIQITAQNNIQIEVYRETVKDESQTYGGYFFELATADGNEDPTRYALFAYHRGIILYNYTDEDEIAKFIEEELIKAFPEIYKRDNFTLRLVSVIDRHRSKPNRDHSRDGTQ